MLLTLTGMSSIYCANCRDMEKIVGKNCSVRWLGVYHGVAGEMWNVAKRRRECPNYGPINFGHPLFQGVTNSPGVLISVNRVCLQSDLGAQSRNASCDDKESPGKFPVCVRLSLCSRRSAARPPNTVIR